jgi:hypothetical protein
VLSLAKRWFACCHVSTLQAAVEHLLPLSVLTRYCLRISTAISQSHTLTVRVCIYIFILIYIYTCYIYICTLSCEYSAGCCGAPPTPISAYQVLFTLLSLSILIRSYICVCDSHSYMYIFVSIHTYMHIYICSTGCGGAPLTPISTY